MRSEMLQRFQKVGIGELDDEISDMYTDLATFISNCIHDSRELTIAMERLEESFLWTRRAAYKEKYGL